MGEPLVSVVTPSFQQGAFIERTLESVRRQAVGRLAGAVEHLVMDGGSTDGTLEILERWRDAVDFTSGPDGGQTAAINAGLARARGRIVAYLNSDDVYYDGALEAVLAAFDADPSADVIYGDADHIDADDRVIGPYPTEPWSEERLREVCFICQPATFLRREAIGRYGDFDATLRYCMDYEYWLRLGRLGARFKHIPVKLAGSRLHAETKTLGSRGKVHAEINDVLSAHLGRVPDVWLSNWAHAVLDARGVPRSGDASFVLRVSMLTLAAALRWNGYPSARLLRLVGSWLKGARWRRPHGGRS